MKNLYSNNVARCDALNNSLIAAGIPASLKYQVVNKNGRPRDAFICNSGGFASPVIYADDLPGSDLEAVEFIRGAIETASSISFNPSNLTDRIWLKAHVYPRLLPGARIQELAASDIACIPIWDLAMVAAVEVGPNQWTLLHSEPLRQASIPLTTLFRQAISNMAECATITPLSEMLAGLGGYAPSHLPIYVVTSSVPYAAAALLSEDIRFKIHDTLGPEFYALPSSVHEFLVIPATGDSAGLLDMVRTINASDVISEDDFLSDNVYYCKSGDVDVIE